MEYRSSGQRGRLGEIDLIMFRGGVLHFIEVKARHSNFLTRPEDLISPKKLKTLKKSIEFFYTWSRYKQYRNYPGQLDLAIFVNKTLTIIPNAVNFD
jgi:Holliday junction resolvase-like predicted endonuclease